MASTPVRPRPSSSPTTQRSCATVSDRAREAQDTRRSSVKSAAELLARVKADLVAIDLLVLDLRLPQSPGRGTGAAIRKLDDGRLPILIFSGTIASADEVRELGDARRRRVPQRVQRRAAHSAVACAAPLSRQLQPPRQSRGRRSAIPVQYRFGNTIAAALTLNLSHGGVGDPDDQPARSRRRRSACGSGCPARKQDVDAEGRVAWSDRRVGMGIQFETLDAAGQAIIDNFVNAHFFSNRRA